MALINRVSRLFRADLHAVLDRIEEPEVLLRQAVREMDEALADDSRRRALVASEYATLRSRESDLRRALDDIEGELDVCFEAGNESLARTMVRRRLESERLAKVLERRRAALEQDLAARDRRIEENRARLESMRQKAEILAAESPEPAREEHHAGPDGTVTTEDVEVAFLREKQRRTAS